MYGKSFFMVLTQPICVANYASRGREVSYQDFRLSARHPGARVVKREELPEAHSLFYPFYDFKRFFIVSN